MIHGRLCSREAIIEIEVSGPDEEPQQIVAVIDTGYNDIYRSNRRVEI